LYPNNDTKKSPRNSVITNPQPQPQPLFNRVAALMKDESGVSSPPLDFRNSPTKISLDTSFIDTENQRKVSFNKILSLNDNEEEFLDKTECEMAEENDVKENIKTMFLLGLLKT
jgi:hypothetical protein